MRSPARWLLLAIVAAGIAGYALATAQARHAAAIGQLNYRLAMTRLRDSMAASEQAYQRDTIIMTKAVTRYVTHRTTDTLVRNDTVYVRRDVADEALASCTAVVLSCEARVGLLTRALAVAESARVPAPPPMPKPSLTAMTTAAAVGAILAAVVFR